MGLIQNQDWEALALEFKNAEPFPNICIDNFLDPEFALELSNSYPDFSNARKMGHEFHKVNEKGKIQITDSTKFPAPVSQLHKELSSQEFINAMQILSGVDNLQFDGTFSGGGMHMTNRSGILDVHVDFNRLNSNGLFRRLNILIYLNEKWREEWGGNVELWDEQVKNCIKSISPILNRCVIFATSDHSFHGVTAVDSPEQVSRKSFAIYLYSDQADSTSFSESHSTIFKARPEEKMKKYILMPIESKIYKLNKLNHKFRKVTKKCWERICERAGQM